jgi:LPS sulfotransferase NodH
VTTTHKSLGYYGPAYDSAQPYEVQTRYAILSAPRTGSSYLCARLANFEGALGVPMEYLHPDAVAEISARAERPPDVVPGTAAAVSIVDYMETLERLRATADGYFGLKAQPAQLLPLAGGKLDQVVAYLREFDKLVFLYRRDKVAQAVSGAIAHTTGRWVNFGEEIELSPQQIRMLFPLIAECLASYLKAEALLAAIAEALADRSSLVIHYEELMDAPDAVLRDVVSFLKPGQDTLPPEQDLVSVPARPAGQRSARLRAAFLAHISNGAD